MSLIFPAHSKGAATEYLAAAHYLALGLQVYWPSVQQGVVDFAIRRGGRYLGVQVKTAFRPKGCVYLQARLARQVGAGPQIATPHSDDYDLLFVLGPRGHRWEIPAPLLGRLATLRIFEPGVRKQLRAGSLDATPYLILDPTNATLPESQP